jgi:hypothetical protein
MDLITLNDIYTRPNKIVAEYLDVLFVTNEGCYEVGVSSVSRIDSYNINEFEKLQLITELKDKYGHLKIIEARITYDNDKYFHLENGILLVVGYKLNSASEYSTNEIWIVEDIHTINLSEYNDFLQLDKLEIK